MNKRATGQKKKSKYCFILTRKVIN